MMADFRKILGLGLFVISGFILMVSFQTVLPSPEQIILDESDRMLDVVKDFCPYYHPEDSNTHETCKKEFDSMRDTYLVVGSILLALGIVSYYQWIKEFLSKVTRSFSK